MIQNLIKTVTYNFLKKTERFSSNEKSLTNINSAALIISAILTQLLLLIFGKWLWNSYLVNTVTIVKPIQNIWQLLAVSIIIKLLI